MAGLVRARRLTEDEGRRLLQIVRVDGTETVRTRLTRIPEVEDGGRDHGAGGDSGGCSECTQTDRPRRRSSTLGVHPSSLPDSSGLRWIGPRRRLWPFPTDREGPEDR